MLHGLATEGRRLVKAKVCGIVVSLCMKVVGISVAVGILTRCWSLFFFSSRRRHTRLQGDWSSDVCSSDLDWRNLNAAFLSHYNVVVFLDTRPEDALQRAAFQTWMEHGGAWMGFHFAGFALTPSAVPANWDWYHNVFLGSGSYVSNTWRPTAAVLRVEDRTHPVVMHLPATFRSTPNEWYR